MIYAPMKMQPCYKEYLWGGRRLKHEFGKADAPENTAESWELASRPDGESRTPDGRTIAELGRSDHDGFWGSDCQSGKFPLLVKLIDAQKALSIQVHPSDGTALTERGEQGKAEMWYIVECRPQAFIYYGFSKRVEKQEVLERARDGSICQVMNRVPVAKGDVFYIQPGTIHAIGAGIILAEIQQNSNTTLRVYDYKRLRTDGTPRPLHLERAVQVMDYTPVIPQECRANSGVSFPAFTMAEMFTCRSFRAYRIDVRESVTLLCDGRSFQHVLCVEGSGRIRTGSGIYPFGRGDSFFMPAALGKYEIRGKCRVLLSRI